jgi:intein/homing endonuclease
MSNLDEFSPSADEKRPAIGNKEKEVPNTF